MMHHVKTVAYLSTDTKLFAEFARQCLAWPLALFHFAARKLPKTCQMRAAQSTREQHFAISYQHRSCDQKTLHQPEWYHRLGVRREAKSSAPTS